MSSIQVCFSWSGLPGDAALVVCEMLVGRFFFVTLLNVGHCRVLSKHCFGCGSLLTVLRAKPDRTQNQLKPYSERIQTVLQESRPYPILNPTESAPLFFFLALTKDTSSKEASFECGAVRKTFVVGQRPRMASLACPPLW